VHTTQLVEAIQTLLFKVLSQACYQGCGVGFLTTLRGGVAFFVRLRMSNWIIFYITLLNWESLLKW